MTERRAYRLSPSQRAILELFVSWWENQYGLSQTENEQLRAKLEQFTDGSMDVTEAIIAGIGADDNAIGQTEAILNNLAAVTGPPDDYTGQLKQATHEAMTDGFIEPKSNRKLEMVEAGTIAALRADNERLWEALSQYGDHTYECELKNGGECSCGYSIALEPKP